VTEIVCGSGRDRESESVRVRECVCDVPRVQIGVRGRLGRRVLGRYWAEGARTKKETECAEYCTKCVQDDTECVEDASRRNECVQEREIERRGERQR
jgi:hypothetical protein